MKIHKVTLTNFRGYRNPTTIDFNDLTVFVGRNDIGKSTILEALDLFFNEGKGVIKYDEGDINITSGQKEFIIGVTFINLPKSVVVDSSYETTGVIYAIEEPETSQHFANQKILADALIELSKTANSQVVLTSHSGVIVKRLHYNDLRLINIDIEGNKYVTHIKNGLLLYPSMNEVNYTAFGEVTEEYHDELYGFIEGNGWMTDYEKGKPQRPYVKEMRDKNKIVTGTKIQNHTLTHYIRDLQHHPENTNNVKYTDKELAQSINDMRTFLETKMSS